MEEGTNSNSNNNTNDDSSTFFYTREQFLTLRATTLTTASIGLVFSVSVLIIFFYMWMTDKRRANRISLRCVVMACFANAIDSIMNITMSKVQGPAAYCRAGGIISNASRLLAASFLAVVGFNLVLIFVINIKRRDLVEYFYYPGVIIYTLICTAVSIYKNVTMEHLNVNYDSCWYMNYVADRQRAVFSWMWYYGFLFLINVCAVFFSIIALCKLISEQRSIRENIDKNIYMGETSTTNSPNKYQARRSAVISKVVIRCIVYPTIPLLVNVWGFVIQLMFTIHRTPPTFVISMFDTIFACLEGFFVAMVFYTDPALTEFLKSRVKHYKRIYVDEYRLIEVRQDDETLKGDKDEDKKSRTLYIMPMDYPGGKSNWDAAIIQTTTTNSSKSNEHHKTIPMRRITIPPSTLNQLSTNYNIRQLSFCNLLTVTNDHEMKTVNTNNNTNNSNSHHDQYYNHHPYQQDNFDESSKDITSMPLPNVSFNSNIDMQLTHSQSNENVIHEVFIPYDGPIFWTRFCNKLFSDHTFSELFSCISTDNRPNSTIVLRSHSVSHTRNKYGLMTDSDDMHTSRHSSVDSRTCHY